MSVTHTPLKQPTTTRKLILVRHGESEENVALEERKNRMANQGKTDVNPFGPGRFGNSPLTKLGVRQACLTGSHLKANPTKVLWTSTLERARHTANCIADFQPGIDLTGMPDLNEKNERQGVREKETMLEFVARVAKFRDLIDWCEIDVLIVGHSRFLSVLTSLLLGEPVQTPLIYRNPNCAITEFEREDGKWRLIYQGSVEHLPETLRTGLD